MTTAPPRASAPEGTETPAGPPPPEDRTGRGNGAPRSGRPRHRLRYAVVGLVLVGSLAFLLSKGLGTALNFYLPADQAVRQEASLGGRTVNLEGVVERGSIRPVRGGVDFVVRAGKTAVPVHDTGSPPELFQGGIPVIAVGHFVRGSFQSDQILVKHSSDYIAAHPGRVTAPNGTKR